MIGSRANFVLVTGGHLQAILRPPGGRSAGYRTARVHARRPRRVAAPTRSPTRRAGGTTGSAWVERRSLRPPRRARARPAADAFPNPRARPRPVRRAPTDERPAIDIGGLRLADPRARRRGHPLLLVNGLGGNVDMWGPAQDAARARRPARSPSTRPAPGARRRRAPDDDPRRRAHWSSGCSTSSTSSASTCSATRGAACSRSSSPATAPDRVRRLALAGTGVGWGGVPGDLRALALIATPLRYYSRTFYERTSTPARRSTTAARTPLARLADAAAHPPRCAATTARCWPERAFTSLPWLHRIEAPTLILAATRTSSSRPRNASLLARELPNADAARAAGRGPPAALRPQERRAARADRILRRRRGLADVARGRSRARRSAVADAVRRSSGGQPYKTVSGWFRRVVLAGR